MDSKISSEEAVRELLVAFDCHDRGYAFGIRSS